MSFTRFWFVTLGRIFLLHASIPFLVGCTAKNAPETRSATAVAIAAPNKDEATQDEQPAQKNNSANAPFTDQRFQAVKNVSPIATKANKDSGPRPNEEMLAQIAPQPTAKLPSKSNKHGIVRVVAGYGGDIRITNYSDGSSELVDPDDAANYSTADGNLRKLDNGDLTYSNRQGHVITIHANNDRTVVVPNQQLTVQETIRTDGTRQTKSYWIDPPLGLTVRPDGSSVERIVPDQKDFEPVSAGKTLQVLTITNSRGEITKLTEVRLPDGSVMCESVREPDGTTYQRDKTLENPAWLVIRSGWPNGQFFGDIQRIGVDSIRYIDTRDHQIRIVRADGSLTRQLLTEVTRLKPDGTLATFEIPEFTIDEDKFGDISLTDRHGRRYDIHADVERNLLKREPKTGAISFSDQRYELIGIAPDGSRSFVGRRGKGPRFTADPGGRVLLRRNPDDELVGRFEYTELKKAPGQVILNKYGDASGSWRRGQTDPNTGKTRWTSLNRDFEISEKIVRNLSIDRHNSLVIDEGHRRTAKKLDGSVVTHEWFSADEKGNRQPLDEREFAKTNQPTVLMIGVGTIFSSDIAYSLTTYCNAAGKTTMQEFKSTDGLFRRGGSDVDFETAPWHKLDESGKPIPASRWVGEMAIDDQGTIIRGTYKTDAEGHAKLKPDELGNSPQEVKGNSRRVLASTTYIYTNGEIETEYAAGGTAYLLQRLLLWMQPVGSEVATYFDVENAFNDGPQMQTILGFQEGKQRWIYDTPRKSFKPERNSNGLRHPNSYTHVAANFGGTTRHNLVTNSRTSFDIEGDVRLDLLDGSKVHTNSRGQLLRYCVGNSSQYDCEYASDGRLIKASMGYNLTGKMPLQQLVVAADYEAPPKAPLPKDNVFRGTELAIAGWGAEKYIAYVDREKRLNHRWPDGTLEVFSKGKLVRVTLADGTLVIQKGHETPEDLGAKPGSAPADKVVEPQVAPNDKSKSEQPEPDKATSKAASDAPQFITASEIHERGGDGIEKFVVYTNDKRERIKQFTRNAALIYDSKGRISQIFDDQSNWLVLTYRDSDPSTLHSAVTKHWRITRDVTSGQSAQEILNFKGEVDRSESVQDFRLCDDGNLVIEYPIADPRAIVIFNALTGERTKLGRDGAVSRNDYLYRVTYRREPGDRRRIAFLNYNGNEIIPYVVRGAGWTWRRDAQPLPGRSDVYKWTNADGKRTIEKAFVPATALEFASEGLVQIQTLKDGSIKESYSDNVVRILQADRVIRFVDAVKQETIYEREGFDNRLYRAVVTLNGGTKVTYELGLNGVQGILLGRRGEPEIYMASGIHRYCGNGLRIDSTSQGLQDTIVGVRAPDGQILKVGTGLGDDRVTAIEFDSQERPVITFANGRTQSYDDRGTKLVNDPQGRLVQSQTHDGQTTLQYDWVDMELSGLTCKTPAHDRTIVETHIAKSADGKWEDNTGNKYDWIWMDRSTGDVCLSAESFHVIRIIRPNGHEVETRYDDKFKLLSEVVRGDWGEPTSVEDSSYDLTRFIRTNDEQRAGEVDAIMQGEALIAKKPNGDWVSTLDPDVSFPVNAMAVGKDGSQIWAASNGTVRIVRPDGKIHITHADGLQTIAEVRDLTPLTSSLRRYATHHIYAPNHELREVTADVYGDVTVIFRDGKILTREAHSNVIHQSAVNQESDQSSATSSGALEVSPFPENGTVTWLDGNTGRLTVFHPNGEKTVMEFLEGLGWYSLQTGDVYSTKSDLYDRLHDLQAPLPIRRDHYGDMQEATIRKSLFCGIDALWPRNISPAVESEGTKTWSFIAGALPGVHVEQVVLRADNQLEIKLTDGRQLKTLPDVRASWAAARCWIQQLARQEYAAPAVAELMSMLSIDKNIRAGHSSSSPGLLPAEKAQFELLAANLVFPLANQGDPIAARWLGERYAAGKYFFKNDKFAAEWFLKAAERGDAEAQYQTAIRLQQRKETEKAGDWFRKAAAQNHARAIAQLKSLADMKKMAQRLTEITTMANNGDTKAMQRLAEMYRDGDGAPLDTVQATEWMTKAAMKGDAEAQYKLATWYLGAKGGYLKLDKETARDWLDKAAKQGHTQAKSLFKTHFGLEPPVTRKEDAAMLNALASLKIEIEMRPDIVNQARGGNPEAMFEVGRIHREKGKLETAAKWFEWSARGNYPPARSAVDEVKKLLGDKSGAAEKTPASKNATTNSSNSTQNKFKIPASLLREAQSGSAGAQLQVGLSYMDAKQWDDANLWLQKSADQGNSIAKKMLAEVERIRKKSP